MLHDFQPCHDLEINSYELASLPYSLKQQIRHENNGKYDKKESKPTKNKKKSAPRVHVRMRIDANYELDLCMHNILLPILHAAFPLKVFIRLLFCSRWRSTLSAKWLKCHTHMSVNCQLTLSLKKWAENVFFYLLLWWSKFTSYLCKFRFECGILYNITDVNFFSLISFSQFLYKIRFFWIGFAKKKNLNRCNQVKLHHWCKIYIVFPVIF